MRLVYERNRGSREVRIGDRVVLDSGPATVTYFAKPHKPESSGRVSVTFISGPHVGHTHEYYVSVIGAKWIEREDQECSHEWKPITDIPLGPHACAKCGKVADTIAVVTNEADEVLLALFNNGVLDSRHPTYNASMAQVRLDAKHYLRKKGLIE